MCLVVSKDTPGIGENACVALIGELADVIRIAAGGLIDAAHDPRSNGGAIFL